MAKAAEPSETSPLLEPAALKRQVSEEASARWIVLRTLALGASTIVLSVSLISFNQDLMQPDRFPYAALLALLHMGFCSFLTGGLYLATPSLFPSLTDPEQRGELASAFVWRKTVPIGLATVTSLVCTNLAYSHISVAFIQMLKEGNIVLVYIFALAMGLEQFAWAHAKVILFACFSAVLAIHGEVNFSLLGFVIQMVAQICESLRIVLTGVLLSGRKLDPMSCVLLVSPVCFALLCAFSLLVAALPASLVDESLALPSAAKLWEFAPLLLANSCIAFALNVSIAVTIKYTSAVSYLFMGVLKDMLAVCVSVLLLHQSISRLQGVAFSMQIGAVVAWWMLKTHLSPLPEACLAAEVLSEPPTETKKDDGDTDSRTLC